jgi:hypothetical protein
MADVIIDKGHNTVPLAPAHPFWRRPKIVITPHDACDVSIQAVAATPVVTADAIRTGQGPPHAMQLLIWTPKDHPLPKPSLAIVATHPLDHPGAVTGTP